MRIEELEKLKGERAGGGKVEMADDRRQKREDSGGFERLRQHHSQREIAFRREHVSGGQEMKRLLCVVQAMMILFSGCTTVQLIDHDEATNDEVNREVEGKEVSVVLINEKILKVHALQITPDSISWIEAGASSADVLAHEEEYENREKEGEIVLVSIRVGYVIDLEERNEYGLFLDIEEFHSAVLFKVAFGSYVFKITHHHESACKERVKWVPRTGAEISQIGEYIEHFDGVLAREDHYTNDKDGYRRAEKVETYMTSVPISDVKEFYVTDHGRGARNGLGLGVLCGIGIGLLLPGEEGGFEELARLAGIVGGAALGGLTGLIIGATKGSKTRYVVNP